MPRYVVLTHDHPILHWDLMLDAGNVLRTWRLSHPPDAAGQIVAERLNDHRRAYLDYEGPVTGNRGEVRRWDAGNFTLLEETPQRLTVQLCGEKLDGTATIEQREGSEVGAFYWIAD